MEKHFFLLITGDTNHMAIDPFHEALEEARYTSI